jgi:hypothetical protein
VGVSQRKRRARRETPSCGAPPHLVCIRAKVGSDLRLASDPSLRGSDWAPSVDEAPRNTTHRPFRARQAEAPIAASVSSDMSVLLGRDVEEEVCDEKSSSA